MRRSVLVKVKGSTENDGETVDEVTVSAAGVYHESKGVHYVSYEDRAFEGIEGRNLIKADRFCLSLKKSGAVRADMIFEAGERHGFLYSTPYGAFDMETKTLYYGIDETEEGLRLKVEYELIHGGQSGGIRKLYIEINDC